MRPALGQGPDVARGGCGGGWRLRSLVSKKKIRWREDGFDLDLTYITPRIIAMGFPAEGIESAYRNRMADVQSFFETYHKGFFRIYNLCSERAYSETAFGSPPAVERHPFDDHSPCPLHMVRPFCESVHAFLEADHRNVVAVHCKAGKGRTGMMISAYLLHSGICRTASEALHTFGSRRTRNGKGVTIPSQRRYVEYYASMLQQLGRNDDMPSPSMLLKTICIPVGPNFDRSGGCSPYFQVYQFSEEKGRMHKVFSSKKSDSFPIGRAKSGQSIFLDVEELGITVRGDTKIVFCDKSVITPSNKMFWFWFHTGLVGEGRLRLTRSEIDNACGSQQSRFPSNFSVSMTFDNTSRKPTSGLSALQQLEMESGLSGTTVRHDDEAAARAATPCYEAAVPAREWLRCIFNLYDVSADGFIDVGEFVQVLQNASFVRMSRSELEKVAQSMDYEGDGSVSWSDFERIMAAKLHLVNPGAPLVGQKAAQVAATYNRLKMLAPGDRANTAITASGGDCSKSLELPEGDDSWDADYTKDASAPLDESRPLALSRSGPTPAARLPAGQDPPPGTAALPADARGEAPPGRRGGGGDAPPKHAGARPSEMKPAIAAAAWLDHRLQGSQDAA